MMAPLVRLVRALGEIHKLQWRRAHARSRRRLRLAIDALGLAIAAAILVTAAAVPSRAGGPPMIGTITDALGRPLPGAAIQLRSANGAALIQAVTGPTGRFTIVPPKAGVYALTAAKAGFNPASKIVTYPTGENEPITLALGAENALTVPVQASVIRGPNTVSYTGANKYTVSAKDIASQPKGDNATITDILVQM
ncbi:MAG: carboxypeptidase-like regulatory domain-containing protein, partial [Candidatus Binataceae bacterium]